MGGMAVVGAGPLAITATSAGVAVARTAPAQPHRSHVPSVAPAQPGHAGAATSRPRTRSGDPRATGSPSGGGDIASPPASKTQPAVDKPLPTDAATAVPTAPVPGRLPNLLPTSLPTSLPRLLPTHLPTILPTVHLPVPTPSLSVSVPLLPLPLPLPQPGTLLGH